MIKEYQQLLDEVGMIALSLGFNKTHDSDYQALFSNDSGWFISFEGERYFRPAFELSIGKDDLKFSVRLLMAVFDVNDKPSLSRQLEFLGEKYNDLFILPPPYISEYERIDSVDI